MAFGLDDAFILSMMAAGAIVSSVNAKAKKELIKMGRNLEQAAINTNLEALRTQNAEASLDAIQALRTNVADQIAINAARGVSSGAGSAATAISDSESVFTQDEKTRRLNLLVKENELRAAGVLSGIHALTSETQLGQSLTNQIFNNIPVSTIADKFKNKGLVSKIEPAPKFGGKSGYGLNSV